MRWSFVVAAAAVLALTGVSRAGMHVQTDRLAYHGAVSYYGPATEENRLRAILGEDPDAVYGIDSRDASLYFSKDQFATDKNIFTVAWYYTTAANTNGQLKDKAAGNNYYSGANNPNNTPVGVVQLYDDDGSTDHTFEATFNGYNGTHWTTLTFHAHSDPNSQTDFGGGNHLEDLTKLWNGKDITTSAELAGEILFWEVQIEFTGLQGVEGADGIVTATDHPDGVVGSFYAIFRNTNEDDPSVNGYYAVFLEFDLDNWAFEQGNDALNGNFKPSKFIAPKFEDGLPPDDDETNTPVTIPVPGASVMGLGLMGVVAMLKRGRSRR